MDKKQIVDAWIQHPTPGFLGHSMFDSLKRWMRATGIPQDIPLEMTVGVLEQAGITKGIINAWWGPQGVIISNDEVASYVRKYPELLIGIGSVDISRPMEAIRELRRCVKTLGFKGLRILPWLWGLPPNDRRYYPLYAECIELGIPFCLQVGHAGPLRPSDPGRPIPYLDEVACEFPELLIVGGHVGYPWTQEMIALATKYPNVYIDTSAYKPSRYPRELVEYMRGHGRKKVLFGSSYPMIMPEVCLSELPLLELDDEAQELFLSSNALKVFSLS